MGALRDFFTDDDEKAILSAIGEAESSTSGEIRVCIDKKAGRDPMAAARRAFEEMGMRATELHNGVLFFLAIEDRKFAILGDDGINEKVPDDFWNTTRDLVMGHFRSGEFAKGLAEGIKLAGAELAEYYPYQADDVNELPDAIRYMDEPGKLSDERDAQ